VRHRQPPAQEYRQRTSGRQMSVTAQMAAASVSAAPPIPSGMSQNLPLAICDAWLYAR
jgi:hypothetical protein